MMTFGPNIDGYHDVSDQLIHHLRSLAETNFRRQESEKAAFTNVPQFEAHRAHVRVHFLDAIGGLPEERTPLNAQITGKVDRGSFVIEKLIYESLPKFYVSAALYVPKGIDAPRPAVVFV
ncbi:MAG: hypothetical protein O3A46_07405, partial [Candidatus Poribacteria bacterium]|nr:hypothetical protein [Candidatus Poribacteria bacterium]